VFQDGLQIMLLKLAIINNCSGFYLMNLLPSSMGKNYLTLHQGAARNFHALVNIEPMQKLCFHGVTWSNHFIVADLCSRYRPVALKEELLSRIISVEVSGFDAKKSNLLMVLNKQTSGRTIMCSKIACRN